jgi:hypothetical protein
VGASADEVARQAQAFDDGVRARLAEHGRLEGVPMGEAFHIVPTDR